MAQSTPDAVALIDSHAHLQAEAFVEDADTVLATARAEGLVRLLAPGWDRASSEASVVFAGRHPDVLGSAGIHPHRAAAEFDAWPTIVELARNPLIAAIGETGLDYDRAFSPRDVQLANLRRHLRLSLEVGKPTIIHCRSERGARDAQDDLIRELRAVAPSAPSRPWALLHSFSGPIDYGVAALELGLAISFSGLVFRQGEEASAEVARLVPTSRLLIETDSPYLSPPGAPRRRNEPVWVHVTLGWLADRRGVDVSVLGHALVTTFDEVFGGGIRRRLAGDPAAP